MGAEPLLVVGAMAGGEGRAPFFPPPAVNLSYSGCTTLLKSTEAWRWTVTGGWSEGLLDRPEEPRIVLDLRPRAAESREAVRVPQPRLADGRGADAAVPRGRALRRERRADRFRHGRRRRRDHGLRGPQAADVRAGRGLPAPREAGRGGRPLRDAVPGGAARQGGRARGRRGRVHLAAVRARLRGRRLAGRVPAGGETQHAGLPAAALRAPQGRPVPQHGHPVRARLPL